MSKNTITLDNFADFQGEVHGIEIQSNLPFDPYVPSTEINVHLGRIARVAKLGHLGSVAFRRYSEQSSVTLGVDSISDDGSATASFSASASKAPRINTGIDTNKDAAPWVSKGHGIIKLNLGHDDLSEINLREAQPWSNYLDRGIREGLRSSSTKKLLDQPLRRGAITVIWGGIPLVRTLIGDVSGGAELYLGNDALFIGVAAALSRFQSRVPRPTGESTIFFPGLAVDRMGLIQAYTRTRKFVEAK